VFLIPAVPAKIPVPVHRRLLSMGEGLTNRTGHNKILGKNDYQVKPGRGIYRERFATEAGMLLEFLKPPQATLYEVRNPFLPAGWINRGYPFLLGPDFPLPVASLGSQDYAVDGIPGKPESVLTIQSTFECA
jgi:hypothetical protein